MGVIKSISVMIDTMDEDETFIIQINTGDGHYFEFDNPGGFLKFSSCDGVRYEEDMSAAQTASYHRLLRSDNLAEKVNMAISQYVFKRCTALVAKAMDANIKSPAKPRSGGA